MHQQEGSHAQHKPFAALHAAEHFGSNRCTRHALKRASKRSRRQYPGDAPTEP